MIPKDKKKKYNIFVYCLQHIPQSMKEKTDDITLDKDEIERYSRHLILPEFNIAGQRKLKKAKVLVVGCGGLGSPVLLYLAAAGVGTIGIVDHDKVDKSNLQRQILFTEEDIGRSKVDAATQRIKAMNSHINIKMYNTALTSDNAIEIIKKYDLVADGTDNFATRYLVNDACVLLGKTNVYASIYRFEGQVSVFNMLRKDGTRGPNYRDLFPEPPPPDSVSSCSEAGVIGVLPGMLGTMQANEIIKVLSGIGKPLDGRIFTLDALNFETRTMKLSKNKNNPLTGNNPTQKKLIDYHQFCGVKTKEINKQIKEIKVTELKRMYDNQENFQLIDVREYYEYEIVNMGGEHIPKNNIVKNLDKISKDKKVIIHCRSGQRSREVITMLEDNYGYINLYNLTGGILAWADKIDKTMPQY